MRQRTKRPCSLSQPVSYSGGKKTLRQPDLRPLQDAALIAFEAPDIIGSQFLSDKAAGLLLALDRIGGDETAFKCPLGQLLQQRFESRNFVALFLDRLLGHRQAQTVTDGRESLKRFA